MVLAVFTSRIFWVALAAFSIGAYCYHLGNTNGSNARAYAAVVKELRIKNAMLTAQLEEDARIDAEEARAAMLADAEFAKAMPGLTPLIIEKKTADALNALIKE